MRFCRYFGSALVMLLSMFILTVSGQVMAAELSDRRVEIVVPVTPGSATDILARVIGEKLASRTGRSVVVTNKPGGLTKIASDYVKRSAPDGHTLLVIHSGIIANPVVYKAFDLDFRKDFSYVSAISWTPWVIAINSKLPVNNLSDLVTYSRNNPGKLNFGTTGGSGELDIRALMQQTGVTGELIVYPGGTQVMTALAANDVQVALNAIRGVESMKGRDVKGIAVTSSKRFAAAQELPTVAESGAPNFKGSTLWFGLLGPAGIPSDIVATLNREVNEILRLPDITARIASMAHEVIGGSPEDFRRLAIGDLETYERIGRESKLEPK